MLLWYLHVLFRLKAAALKQFGTWHVEAHSENADIIISDYFLKSIKLLRGIQERTPDDNTNMCETYFELAKFADTKYQQVCYSNLTFLECNNPI